MAGQSRTGLELRFRDALAKRQYPHACGLWQFTYVANFRSQNLEIENLVTLTVFTSRIRSTSAEFKDLH
jgi:hypothetical protein